MTSQTQSEQGGPGNQGRRNGQHAQQQGGAMQTSEGRQGNALQSRGGQWNPSRYSRDPFSMIEQLSNEMDQLFESFAFPGALSRRRGGPRQGLSTLWAPEVDIHEDGNQLRICVDLPGIPKDNVKVDVEDGQITIQGERQEERTEGGDGRRTRRTERRYGSFYRTIPLPEGADAEQAQANMKDGVLEITLPLSEKLRGRRLEIQGG